MTRVWWLFVLGLLGLALLLAGCGRQQQPNFPPPVRSDSGSPDELFSGGALRIEIEIPRAGISALRRTHWGSGGERPKVRATVREGDVVYYNVALHLKGAAGSFRPIDDRPAMTLNFDKFAPGQRFHGLEKISLNNSVQDPSFLSEKISRELFDQAGVPVPRAGHALVKLNGRDLGLYVLLEGANKQFLKRHFANASGNLYDGGFVSEIHDSLAVNCGTDRNNRSGLTRLLAALEETRRSKSLEALEQALDVDRFLTMIAMEVMLCHWDGYALNRNNWRIFHDLDADRMVFIPHGLDQTFGAGQHRYDRANLILPPMSGKVAMVVLGTAEGRKRYQERVSQLCTSVFQVARILDRIEEIEAELRPALLQWSSSAARNQEYQASRFKDRVARRAGELSHQVNTPLDPLRFGSDDVARLTGWKPSSIRAGQPILTRAQDDEGQTLFGIKAGHGISTGSWRTRVILAEGRYQIAGRVRVHGVTIDPGDLRAGAGLRVSKGAMPFKLSGTAEWTDIGCEFVVEKETADVELICELRALRGEAWFDAASLRLVRLQ